MDEFYDNNGANANSRNVHFFRFPPSFRSNVDEDGREQDVSAQSHPKEDGKSEKTEEDLEFERNNRIALSVGAAAVISYILFGNFVQ